MKDQAVLGLSQAFEGLTELKKDVLAQQYKKRLIIFTANRDYFLL